MLLNDVLKDLGGREVVRPFVHRQLSQRSLPGRTRG